MLTNHKFAVVLVRKHTGSKITIAIEAVSEAQARRLAENQLHGWRVIRLI